MRNRSHNRRGVLNTANPDWQEDRGTYGRGYQNHGYEDDRGNFNYGREGYGTSIGGRYTNYGSDRNYNDRGSYTENQYSRDSGLNRGRYWGDRDEGFGSGYNDWRSSYGNDYSRDYLNYGSERGAGDEFDRANYERRGYYRGGNFGGGSYGSDYNRNRRDYDADRGDRGWWDKTSDEVSSWFGDEDAERRRELDKMRSGQHRGKGPKGYTRSDERIKEDINDRLSDDVFIDASEIEVNVNNGEVILTGTVDDRSAKRRAEDIADDVSGVRNVENRIRVTTSQATSQWSGDTGTAVSNSSIGTTSTQTTSGERTSDRSKIKQTM